MPFTPFHFGLGIACKALTPRHIALLPFMATQVAMDIEPAVRMAIGSEVLHGWSHSWPGSLAVGVGVAALWYPMQGRRIWRIDLGRGSLGVLLGSTMLGTLSHVWLDSLMHPDMDDVLASWAGSAAQRLAPEAIEFGFLLAAAMGLVLCLARARRRQVWRSLRATWDRFLVAPAWFERRDS